MKCTDDKGCGENPCICKPALFCEECDLELTSEDIENGFTICEGCQPTDAIFGWNAGEVN